MFGKTNRSSQRGNSNNSYWLTDANDPLTGFPTVMGPVGYEGLQQFLRTRIGHLMVAERKAASDGLSETPLFDLQTLKDMMYRNRVYGAEIVLDDVLEVGERRREVEGQPVRQRSETLYDDAAPAEPWIEGVMARTAALEASVIARFAETPEALAKAAGISSGPSTTRESRMARTADGGAPLCSRMSSAASPSAPQAGVCQRKLTKSRVVWISIRTTASPGSGRGVRVRSHNQTRRCVDRDRFFS